MSAPNFTTYYRHCLCLALNTAHAWSKAPQGPLITLHPLQRLLQEPVICACIPEHAYLAVSPE